MRSDLESVHRLAFGLVPELPGQEDRVAWSGLLEAAAVEELEGLLYHRCRSLGLTLPAEADQRWGEAYRSTAARTLDLLAELERLLAGLAAAGIEVLVLPGAALLPLYPDPGCRPMDDLDLLAPPGTLATVVDAIVSLGFSRIPRHPALLSRRGLVVDLHDDPLNSGRVSGRRLGGRLDPALVWQARRPRRLEGLPVQVLGPEDEVLYTAAHALRHSFRRITWLLDLEGQSRTGMDWDSLRRQARRTGLERALLHGMRLLRDLLGGVGRDLPAPPAAWLEAMP
ncbi:MAG: nucleotidyltransferase family protein, partial [Candidatus Latescibacterota bacterium]